MNIDLISREEGILMRTVVHARVAGALLAMALTGAFLGTPAQAQSLLFANTNAGAGYKIYGTGFSPVSLYDPHASSSATLDSLSASSASATGNVAYIDTIYTPEGVLQPVWLGNSSGSAWTSASYGALHASVAAEYHQMPHTFSASGYHDNEPWGVSKISPLSLWARGNTYAAFEDTITVTSATLPFGTRVQVKASILLHSSAFNGDRVAVALATNSTFDTNPWFIGPGVDNPGYGLYLSDSGGSSLSLDSYLYFKVGIATPVWGMLTASAAVPAAACNGGANPPNCGDQSAFIDAGNTARFFLDPLSADVTLTASSGTNYSITAVPEPRSGLLLLAGMALVGATISRRRRQGPPTGRLASRSDAGRAGRALGCKAKVTRMAPSPG